jgi:Double zinc ribbon
VTAQSNLVCRRCGFTNVPGDQFCGSCGAFLEWEGEPSGQPEPPPAEPRDPDVPVVGPPGGSAAGVPAPVVTPRAEPVAPPVTSPGDAGLIRCPACGIANAATRTFCQSCGTKLVEAPRVAEVTTAQIAAAVHAPARPAGPPPAPGRSAKDRPQGGSSGGILKWIVIMAVLGVVVGVGIVGATQLLKGKGPSSDATTAPSTAASGAHASPGASGAAPSGAAPSGPTPSGEATAPPSAAPKPVALVFTGAGASSVVGNLPKFAADRAIDGDPATCWQEGSRIEKGAWIEVTFAPSRVTSLVLTNGYNASQALYRGNLRLKDITISVDGGAPVKARLADTGDPQKVNIKDVASATRVRITIVTTYPSVQTKVSGTPFDDAALGEIVVMGVPGS